MLTAIDGDDVAGDAARDVADEKRGQGVGVVNTHQLVFWRCGSLSGQ